MRESAQMRAPAEPNREPTRAISLAAGYGAGFWEPAGGTSPQVRVPLGHRTTARGLTGAGSFLDLRVQFSGGRVTI
jgi:hypothetical protein